MKESDIYCRAPFGTIARIGGHRGDGHTWGWRGVQGWLWFRSEAEAVRFDDTYRRNSVALPVELATAAAAARAGGAA